MLVWNWEPGVNLYIDVSVIDPTGQEWRNDLIQNGAGRAAVLKGNEKRKYYKNHFNLVEKINEFAPFVIEAQGGVGTSALKIIKTILQKKKERNLRSSKFVVEENEVMGGDILKKILFESQRQMARTLLDKTTREDHSLSKKLETQMLIAEASRKAAKNLRSEKFKVKPATVLYDETTEKTNPWNQEPLKLVDDHKADVKAKPITGDADNTRNLKLESRCDKVITKPDGLKELKEITMTQKENKGQVVNWACRAQNEKNPSKNLTSIMRENISTSSTNKHCIDTTTLKTPLRRFEKKYGNRLKDSYSNIDDSPSKVDETKTEPDITNPDQRKHLRDRWQKSVRECESVRTVME